VTTRIFISILLFSLAACTPQPPTQTSHPDRIPTSTFTKVPAPAGEIVFTADRLIIQAGECTVLHWQVPQGFGVAIDEESVPKVGEREVCPEQSHVYQLSVDMGDRIETRQVEISLDSSVQLQEFANPPAVTPGIPAYQADTWVSTGGPPGGLGYDIRMDPRNPDVLYVTDAWAGAFKSTDGGRNWFPINNGINTRTGPSGDAVPVFSLTLDPNNPDTLWAGTQFSSGIFRSDDGGQNWRQMNTGRNGVLEKSISVRGISIEPGNSDVVYFAGEISSWEWNGTPLPGLGLDMTKGVVYKTIDGGRNWERIWYGDNLTRYIWINPEDHNLIYVSTGIFDREAANSNPETLDPGGVGILRSRDGGNSWEILADSNGFRSDELYFGSLFMHPDNPDILIAASGNDPYMTALGHPIGAIYLTEDGGDNWQRVLALPNASTVEICTSDPSVMYAGSINGIYRSRDGGHNWVETTGGLWGSQDVLAGFPIDMQCDLRDPNRIFINNYIGGNFLSEDGGVTWQVASKGYTGALLRQIAVARTNPLSVYTANRMGVFVSRDSGDTWNGTAHGPARVPEAIAVAVSPFNADYILGVLADGGPEPKLSQDGGMTWRNISTGFWQTGMFNQSIITRFIFSDHDPNLVLATAGVRDCYLVRETCESGGMGIIRSTDRGNTWAQTSLKDKQVLDVDIVNEALAYAAVYPADLYRSTDGGVNWESISQNISDMIPGTFIDINFPKPIIISIGAFSSDPNMLYAGFERGGLMTSQDGGLTWVHDSAGMPPETTIMDIEPDGVHPGVIYLASSSSGIYYTENGKGPWTTLNKGLLTRTAMDLALTADGSVLYLATNGGGVFRLGPTESQ
jgi:photosystem II stability/assembly factor-like uncharacterized protein